MLGAMSTLAYARRHSLSLERSLAVDLADRVLVVKSERKLYLLKGGRELREFDVALGLVPSGHKRREGDFRTPEGRYVLDVRNADSDYFLSIHVSYPNAKDRAHAAKLAWIRAARS